MAKQFTEWAKEVLSVAREEASRRCGDHVRPEHLLAALFTDPESTASQTLAGLGVDVSGMIAELYRHVRPGTAAVAPDEMVFAPEAKRVIERAIAESERMGHDHIGTEHLLLGLLQEGGEPVAGLLSRHGVDAGRVQAEISRNLEPDDRPAAAAVFTLTPRVREALEAALAEVEEEKVHAARSGEYEKAAWWQNKEAALRTLLD